jgi:predicted Zn-dependent peptidase
MTNPLNRALAPEAKSIRNFTLLPASSETLANGVPFTYVSGSAQPILHLQFVFEAGRRHERLMGQAGYMDKLLGEGTVCYSAQQVSEHFDAYGAFWQASSGTDWTTVECYCLSKHLSSLLPMLEEILLHSTFPDDEWETVKAISKQQIQVSELKNSYLASTHFKARLFGSHHPYGYRNTPDIIDALGTDDFRAFFRQCLTASRMRLFAAGDLSEAHIELLRQTVGQWPVPDAQPLPALPPLETAFGKHYIERPDALQSALRLGMMSVPRNHPDQIGLQVLTTVLGGYFGSRLMQNIREEKGLTYGIHASLTFLKDMGFLYISADVQKAQCELAMTEVYREIERLRQEPVPAEELETVQNYLCGTLVKSIDSALAVANCHKAIALYQLPADYYDRYTERVWAVTPEQLQDLAQRYWAGPWVEVVAG